MHLVYYHGASFGLLARQDHEEREGFYFELVGQMIALCVGDTATPNKWRIGRRQEGCNGG